MHSSTTLPLGFAHRINEDGTFDSICCGCFMTIANEATLVELKKAENEHDCEMLMRQRLSHSTQRIQAVPAWTPRL
jgi:hypothetical protein